jgi:hypothetical protein
MTETQQRRPDTDASTRHDQLIEGLSPRLKGKAGHGASVRRKQLLSSIPTPNHVLDAVGVDVPHRSYIDSPDDAIEYPTTFRDDGEMVHLHQDVRERTDDEFGSFGSADADTDEVIWTVVGLDNGTVDLTVVGDWGKRRSIDHESFFDEYEPLTLADGQPQWGY